MNKINLYYWNNGVGVVNDTLLISSLFDNVNQYELSNKLNEYDIADIGIYIQNIDDTTLQYNKKNIFIANEEWITSYELGLLSNFECIIVKSKHAKQLLDPYHKNVIYAGFFSLSRFENPIHTGNILHFKGKSIQKNHELAFKYKYKYNINIIDSETNYLTEADVIKNLNSHDIHICCSLYEAWGHYLWEAMSCGKLVICSEIPVFKEHLDPNLVKFIPIIKTINYDPEYRFLNNNNYQFRTGYFVDEIVFEELLDESPKLLEYQKEKSNDIINFTKNVINTHKIKFIKIIKNI
jgi:hypothetical protein